MDEIQKYNDELKSCFTGILELSEQQLNLVKSADSGKDISRELLDLMGERENLARKIDSIYAEAGQKAGKSDVISRTFSQQITAINRNDEQIKELVDKTLRGLKSKLQKTQTSMKAYKAYSAVFSDTPWFIDKKK